MIGDRMALGQQDGQRIILTAPIPRTPIVQGYGPREAWIEITLLTAQLRRRLLKANDEHGNKFLRKEILDAFGELGRFSSSKLHLAGILNASDIDFSTPQME